MGRNPRRMTCNATAYNANNVTLRRQKRFITERPSLGRQPITPWQPKKEIFSIGQQVFDAWKPLGSRLTRLGR